MVKTVLASGVFDLLHPGHLLFLEEARKLGGRLVVVVARDDTAETRKNRRPLVPERQRLRMVESLKPVDKAVLGDKRDYMEPVLTIKPDVIALGADQDFSEKELESWLLSHGLKTKVVRVKKTWRGGLNSSKKIAAKIRRRK